MGLVSAQWLIDRLGDVVVADCRFTLGSPGAGRRAWEEGRVPGAAFVDVERELSAPPGGAAGGRHPLPTAEAFASVAARLGIGAGSTVVAYDEAGEGGAARLWWLLRHFGHERGRAAVLDGGMRGWRAAGGPVEAGGAGAAGAAAAGPPAAEPSGAADPAGPAATAPPFQSRERTDDILSANDIRARLDDPALALVDARAAERYRGETEPIDPVAGHIPGARNVPFGELTREGRYLEPAELRERLDPGAGRELVAYCGSGITAATLVLAAEVAGIDARLYPGSWSEWCALGGPVATGD